jgi:hypothetical protein
LVGPPSTCLAKREAIKKPPLQPNRGMVWLR